MNSPSAPIGPSPPPELAPGLSRRLKLALFALGLLAVAVGAQFLRPKEPVFEGEVALLDGTNIRIAAVSYGTNHVFGPPLARWAARLPGPAQALVRRIFGGSASPVSSIGSTEPHLVIWLHRWTNSGAIATNRSIYFNAFLADGSEFVSGQGAYLAAGGSALEKVDFKAVPRRDKEISVGFVTWLQGGSWTNCGSLRFANPVFSSTPEWVTEATPVTKRSGDVEATLIRLSTGHGEDSGYKGLKGGSSVLTFSTNRSNGRNGTVCQIHLRSVTNAAETWGVANVRVRDAAGNDVRSSSMSWGGDHPYFRFQPSLWPGETWKLDCEVKRKEGFGRNELITFHDVPLGAMESTNYLGWTTNFAGVSVTLGQFIYRRPLTNNSWSSSDLSGFTFTHSALSTNVHLDFVSMKSDTGETASSESSRSSDGEKSYHFRKIPAGIKSLSITLAVHQSHWIEFLVKPEVGTARIEIPPSK